MSPRPDTLLAPVHRSDHDCGAVGGLGTKASGATGGEGPAGSAWAWSASFGQRDRDEPSFLPHATEAVWELAEHRYLFIVQDAEGAGRATHTIFVDDLDTLVADIASRGIEPDERVTYPGKARKAIYRDPDGSEIGFGAAID